MEMRLDMKHTGVLIFDLQDGEADEKHTHDHFQLSVPLSGDLLTLHNDRTRKLQAHESLLVPPGDIHQHEAFQDRKEIMLISFNEEIVQSAYQNRTGERLHEIDFSPVQPYSQELLHKAKSIFQTASFEGIEEAMKWEEFFTSVILEHMKGSHTDRWNLYKKEQAFSVAPTVQMIKDYIQEYYQENVTLDALLLS